MATDIRLKKSSVAGRIPDSSNLEYGELAINYQDGKLYYKNAGGGVKAFLDSANVSSMITDRQGTDSADVVNIINSTVDSSYVNLRVPTNQELRTTSDVTFTTVTADLNGAIEFTAKNAEGSTLTKGTVVYISGVSGNNPTVAKADASDPAKMPAFGIVSEDANNNANTVVFTFGTLYNLDTSAFNAGDTLYVSTTAGELTNTKPTGGSNLLQNIGRVIRSHASAGSIKVGGAGRTNATPNLDEGYIFYGNSSNQAVSTELSTIIDSDYITARVKTLEGDISVVGHLIPSVDSTYDLGSSANKWRSLYVSGNSIHLGSIVLTDSDGKLSIKDSNSALITEVNLNANNTDQLSEGSTNLYYTNARVETLIDSAYIQARQVDLQRDSDFIKTVQYGNNERLKFGASDQLQIYSNGTNSFITEGGSGDLVLQGANIRFENGSGEYYVRTFNNGKVGLYYDNTERFETLDSGVNITGNLRINNAPATFGIDSSAVIGIVDSDYVLNRASASFPIHNQDSSLSHYEKVSFTVKTQQGVVKLQPQVTIDSSTPELVDIDFVFAGIDSSATINLIDSDYVQARVAAGTDSATVSSIIASDVDSDYVALRFNHFAINTSQVPAIAGGTDGIAIGGNVSQTGNFGIAIGRNIAATKNGSVAIGNTVSHSDGSGAQIGIGPVAETRSTGSISIGYDATSGTSGQSSGASVAIGYIAHAPGEAAIGIGRQVDADAENAIAIGRFADVESYSTSGIAIGRSAQVSQSENGIALGLNARSYDSNSIAIGYDAITTASRQLMLGTADNTTGLTSIKVGNPSYSPSDSNEVATKGYVDTTITSTVDSAYVQARQSGGEITIQEEGSALSTAATTLNFVGDNVTATGTGTTKTITISGGGGGGGGTTGSFNQVSVNSYTGDSSTTAFTLSQAPTGGSENNVVVTINGVVQHTNSYSLSGTTVTLDSAPETGDEIEMRVHDDYSANIQLRDYKSYVYTPSVSTTAFSGADDNGATLAYDDGKVEVFLNGSRLVTGLDYTETNSSTITLGEAIDSGDTLEIVSVAKAAIADFGVAAYDSDFLTTDADQIIHTFPAASFRTVKYIAQIEHDSDNKYHSEEILLAHNGTTVGMTTYSQVLLDSNLGTFDADISGANVRLKFTPTYTNTSVKLRAIRVNA